MSILGTNGHGRGMNWGHEPWSGLKMYYRGENRSNNNGFIDFWNDGEEGSKHFSVWKTEPTFMGTFEDIAISTPINTERMFKDIRLANGPEDYNSLPDINERKPHH